MEMFGHEIHSRNLDMMLLNPIAQGHSGTVSPVAAVDVGRHHLDKLRRHTIALQEISSDTCRGILIVDIAAASRNGAPGSENLFITAGIELFDRRARGVRMDPAFDHQNVGIKALGYREKWINADEEDAACEQ